LSTIGPFVSLQLVNCPRPILGIGYVSQAFKDLGLEHVQRKLPGFFDHDMRQLFDFERVLVDQMIPFYGDALAHGHLHLAPAGMKNPLGVAI
jgi:hypothetical protein